MKTFCTLLLMIFTAQVANAQIDVLGKIEEKVEQKVDQKTDEAIDKALEDKEKKEESESEKKEEKSAEKSSAVSKPAEASFTSYSKFDFVPGENVVFFDDFSNVSIGDFPANWNTNGSAEVVTIGSSQAKWLKWTAGASYSPQLKNPFPDNFTLEYDVLMKSIEGRGEPYFSFSIYDGEKDDFASPNNGGSAGVNVEVNNGWLVTSWNGGDGQQIGESRQIMPSSLFNTTAHISVWGQKQRMRIYVNETKVIDLPQAFPSGHTFNKIKFNNNPGFNYSNEDVGMMFLGNMRIAVGAPDMRSKLLTEGKLVTRGILFDVNSDKIKAESYGTLKEIASVLKENSSVHVKIIGHTDSDGDDNKNLELSKKRSAAVKNSLVKDFSIESGRMETDGKGESQPASPNTNAEGKANNRRVEFIKL